MATVDSGGPVIKVASNGRHGVLGVVTEGDAWPVIIGHGCDVSLTFRRACGGGSPVPIPEMKRSSQT